MWTKKKESDILSQMHRTLACQMQQNAKSSRFCSRKHAKSV